MAKEKTIKDYEDDIKLFERYFKIDDLCESYKSYRSAKNKLKKKGISNKRKNKLEKILKETHENHRTYKKYDNLINRMKKKQRKMAASTPPPQPSHHQQQTPEHITKITTSEDNADEKIPNEVIVSPDIAATEDSIIDSLPFKVSESNIEDKSKIDAESNRKDEETNESVIYLDVEDVNNNKEACLSTEKSSDIIRPSSIQNNQNNNNKLIQFAGLNNLGSTCYINSLLQQFFFILLFRNEVLQGQEPQPTLPDSSDKKNENENQQTKLFVELQKLFTKMLHPEERSLDTTSLVGCITQFDGHPTRPTEQQDVVEFFNLFSDRLCPLQFGEATTPTNKPTNIFSKIFGGELCSVVTCKSCSHESLSLEAYLYLSVDVKGKKNLFDSLREFIRSEELCGDHQYFCDFCKRKQNAKKQTCIQLLPPTLIFHLKRFEFRQMQKIKLNDTYEFPVTINMSEFSSRSEFPKEYYQYKLSGVLVHTGTADFGHYYSLIRDRSQGASSSDEWYCMNDSHVTKFDISQLQQKTFGGTHEKNKNNEAANAYMLFYERIGDYCEDEQEEEKLELSSSSNSNEMAIDDGIDVSSQNYSRDERMDDSIGVSVDQPKELEATLESSSKKKTTDSMASSDGKENGSQVDVDIDVITMLNELTNNIPNADDVGDKSIPSESSFQQSSSSSKRKRQPIPRTKKQAKALELSSQKKTTDSMASNNGNEVGSQVVADTDVNTMVNQGTENIAKAYGVGDKPISLELPCHITTSETNTKDDVIDVSSQNNTIDEKMDESTGIHVDVEQKDNASSSTQKEAHVSTKQLQGESFEQDVSTEVTVTEERTYNHHSKMHPIILQTYQKTPWIGTGVHVWVLDGNKGFLHGAKILSDPFFIKSRAILETSLRNKFVSGLKFRGNICVKIPDIDLPNIPFGDPNQSGEVSVVYIRWSECGRKDIIDCARVHSQVFETVRTKRNRDGSKKINCNEKSTAVSTRGRGLGRGRGGPGRGHSRVTNLPDANEDSVLHEVQPIPLKSSDGQAQLLSNSINSSQSASSTQKVAHISTKKQQGESSESADESEFSYLSSSSGDQSILSPPAKQQKLSEKSSVRKQHKSKKKSVVNKGKKKKTPKNYKLTVSMNKSDTQEVEIGKSSSSHINRVPHNSDGNQNEKSNVKSKRGNGQGRQAVRSTQKEDHNSTKIETEKAQVTKGRQRWKQPIRHSSTSDDDSDDTQDESISKNLTQSITHQTGSLTYNMFSSDDDSDTFLSKESESESDSENNSDNDSFSSYSDSSESNEVGFEVDTSLTINNNKNNKNNNNNNNNNNNELSSHSSESFSQEDVDIIDDDDDDDDDTIYIDEEYVDNQSSYCMRDELKVGSFQHKKSYKKNAPADAMLLQVKILQEILSEQPCSDKGLWITCDDTRGNELMISAERPAVQRNYYGKTITKDDNGYLRYTYGSATGSLSVGIPSHQFKTRDMNRKMKQLCDIVYDDVKGNHALKDLPFHEGFNHMTILYYYSIDGIKKKSTLGIHADSVWTAKGEFAVGKNTQSFRTPTVILTFGDDRILKWFIRTTSSRGTWKDGEILKDGETTLDHQSLFVLHPDDEKPVAFGESKYIKYQRMHGNVKMNKGELSIAFVFRNCSKQSYYDENSLYILSEGEASKPEEYIELTNNKRDKFLKQKGAVFKSELQEIFNSTVVKYLKK